MSSKKQDTSVKHEATKNPTQGSFNLKQHLYEDAKHAIGDYEENHPGTIKKIAGASLIAVGTTVLII